jgi:hypothetical protein
LANNEHHRLNGRSWGVLALALGLAFPSVLVGLQAFFYRDFGVLSYPAMHFLQNALAHGQLPLWNPLSHCGTPFLAQWGPMALYPPTWLLPLAPQPWGLSFFCLAHLLLGGLGMRRLILCLIPDHRIATFGGLAFIFNGVTLSSLMWPNYTAALAWAPWVLVAGLRTAQAGGSPLLWLMLCAALQVLTGVPELTVFTGLVLLVMSAMTAAQQKNRGAVALRLAVAAIGTAALTAAQTWPFLELLQASQRDASFATGKWAMPLWGWANLVVPLFHYFETPQGIMFQANQAFLASYYPGLGLLVLALWGAWHQRANRLAIALTTLGLLGLMLAWGDQTPVYAWLRTLFPPLGVARYCVKFTYLTLFCALPLAAWGLQWWLAPADRAADRSNRWRWLIGSGVVAVLLTVLLLAALRARPLEYDQWSVTARNSGVRLALLALLLASLAGCRLRPARSSLFLGLAGLALWLDVTSHLPHHNPTLAARFFTPGWWTTANQAPPPVPGAGRCFISPAAEEKLLHSNVADWGADYSGKRLALWSNLNLLEQIPKVNGAMTLQVRAQKEIEKILHDPHRPTPPEGLLDFLAVNWITAPGRVVEWTNRPTALPWATAGQKPEFLDEAATLSALAHPAFQPRKQVFLPLAAAGIVKTRGGGMARIVATNFTPEHIRIRVEATGPAWVVLAQTHYPAWQATVNGQKTTVWKANHAFQAVEVPGGSSEVIFRYVDRPFRAGLALTLASLLAWCIGWRWCRRKEKQAAAAPDEDRVEVGR